MAERLCNLAIVASMRASTSWFMAKFGVEVAQLDQPNMKRLNLLGNDRLPFDHFGDAIMQHGDVGVRNPQISDVRRLLVFRQGGEDTRHTQSMTWSRNASDLRMGRGNPPSKNMV